jgi:ADP-ribosyl-[dinitrogen reductase] hydrolase
MKTHETQTATQQAILGCLLGTAVGDAIGLPTEGMSQEKARRFHRNGLQHRLLFGKGMFSDDTEHTLMIATALIRHPDDAHAFQRRFSRSLRWWLLALPAGVGISTTKAILRMWIGFSPMRSGIPSAGNGAAMRSAILGACFASDPEKRRSMTLAACRLTHTGPRAEESAYLVSEAASLAAREVATPQVLEDLRDWVQSQEMKERFASLEAALQRGDSVSDYATKIGCPKGVSGFAPNSVAVALYAWLRHRGDYPRILTEVILCGGDTDSVAAIAGGIAGAEVGEKGIPATWIHDIWEWPRSTAYIRKLAEAITQKLEGKSVSPPKLAMWMILPRNLLFLFVVISHGFLRLIPR